MTNGQYAVTGGFWALPTLVQTPGDVVHHQLGPAQATLWWTARYRHEFSGVPTTLPARFYRLTNQ